MITDGFANSFGALSKLETALGDVHYFRLATLQEAGLVELNRLPFSIRILLEAVLRSENGREVTKADVTGLAGYDPADPSGLEIPFKPSRVLLQDFTGVPAVVDLAAMRGAVARLGGNPDDINPRIPVNLVIDHSVQVDAFASPDALRRNAELELERNEERYKFLRWGQTAFDNFEVVPPASGICHQVNLEYLAKVVQRRTVHGLELAFPDTLVGTDSHTPMVNGLGVVGWGVGGIEAEATMLGQPLYMLAPAVVGVHLTGELPPDVNATDLVLAVTKRLRAHGVVGKFVEFFGDNLSALSVPDRATISNMAPEYGATVGFFPTDEATLEYMWATGRPEELITLTREYCAAQALLRTEATPAPTFSETIEIDLSQVAAAVAGPKRPQDRIALPSVKAEFKDCMERPAGVRGFGVPEERRGRTEIVDLGDAGIHEITHGAVAIAAITSCTNTSNPSVMLAAGLLARNAVAKGLTRKPWVKTSLAPGSKVVTEYLTKTDLLPALEALGFHVVGYGCTSCIGNSGPLPAPMQAAERAGLVLASITSSNRNFEGRISPSVRASYLASPPLVVAYALAGTVDVDLTRDPVGADRAGRPVFLKDIWPSEEEIASLEPAALDPDTFRKKYTGIERSNATWNALPAGDTAIYDWDTQSTYIQEPPFFLDMPLELPPVEPIENARALVMVGDSITTDHISPAGPIPADGPAGHYLVEQGVAPSHFNSFGSRRGNDRVMTRGTFANIRLRNLLAPETEGGVTTHLDSGEIVSIHEAAERYGKDGVPTVVLAGKDYGMGSSRDWAAKGTKLLGVRAVIAESFERIHRSNLVGMGVLPLELEDGQSVGSLGLTGKERFTVHIDDDLTAKSKVRITAQSDDGLEIEILARCRLDTPIDVDYFRNGGILHTVLRNLVR